MYTEQVIERYGNSYFANQTAIAIENQALMIVEGSAKNENLLNHISQISTPLPFDS